LLGYAIAGTAVTLGLLWLIAKNRARIFRLPDVNLDASLNADRIDVGREYLENRGARMKHWMEYTNLVFMGESNHGLYFRARPPARLGLDHDVALKVLVRDASDFQWHSVAREIRLAGAAVLALGRAADRGRPQGRAALLRDGIRGDGHAGPPHASPDACSNGCARWPMARAV
jgi:hypothetical protein